MTTYLEWVATRGPRWIRGVVDGWGDRWARAWGAFADALTEGARSAAKVRFPSTTPVDGVPHVAAERHLEQYPSESLDAWRERIGRAWSQWHQGGRNDAIVYQLERWGIGHVEVREHHDFGHVPGDGNARFVVILGDGADAGSLPFSPLTMPFVLGPEVTLGSTATPAEVRQIRGVIRKWKSSHSLLVAVILRFVGASLDEPHWPRDPANPEATWVGANNTLSIGIPTMPFLPYGYREDQEVLQ